MKKKISQFMNKVIIILGMLILISNTYTYFSQAEEDTVFFYGAGTSGGEEETHEAFIGEKNIYLCIIFGTNCSNWSIDVKHQIFKHNLTDYEYRSINKGHKITIGLELNPNLPEGYYSVPIWFNYSDDKGNDISTFYNYSMNYIRILNIKNLILPTSANKVFEIVVQSFIDMRRINVTFYSVGNIITEPETIEHTDLPSGNYSFKTKIIQQHSIPDLDQKIGYSIDVWIGDRTVSFSESEIAVSIIWSNSVDLTNYIPIEMFATFICGLIVVIICINYWNRNKMR